MGVMAPLLPQPKWGERTATWAVWCELVGRQHVSGSVNDFHDVPIKIKNDVR